MRVNREQLLNELEAVLPGLARKETVSQTASFIFKDGYVHTCNDEVACSIKTILKIKGAVYADKFINFLRLSKEEDMEIDPKSTELVVRGKKDKAYINMEAEINEDLLNAIKPPKRWKKLHEDFSDAVAIVHECASDDTTTPRLTYVHVYEKGMEAADNYQSIRYKFKTGFSKYALFKKDYIKQIVNLGMTEFSERSTWTHFRNPTGLVFSCRRWQDDFPKLDNLLKVYGTPTVLPKGLCDLLDKAALWTSEIKDKNSSEVIITLNKGRIKIRAIGVTGKYFGEKRVSYRGKPMTFTIPPTFLSELIKRHNELLISSDAIKVDGGKFVFNTSVGEPEEPKK